jgi:translation elongation factor EF-4
VIAGLKSTRQARIGDTIYVPSEWINKSEKIQPLDGYEASKPMLFASIFPVNTSELDSLFAAVDRLSLNDSSISVSRDLSASLGSGLRCGFLGFLHMEVFNQRLHDEFDMDVVMTTPSVPYKLMFEDGTSKEISCVSHWPDEKSKKFEVLEPVVKVILITPKEYYGAMVELIKDRRGTDIEVQYIDDATTISNSNIFDSNKININSSNNNNNISNNDSNINNITNNDSNIANNNNNNNNNQVILTSYIPWQEVVCDMNDQVKHASSGYASFNYEGLLLLLFLFN